MSSLNLLMTIPIIIKNKTTSDEAVKKKYFLSIIKIPIPNLQNP